MHSLQGKNAFITGGAAGIGRAIAENFVANGAKVTIGDIAENGPEVAEAIGADFARCDVSDEESVVAAYEQASSRNGTLDVIVLNAGIFLEADTLETTPTEVMRKVVDVNLMGVYFGLKHGLRFMNDGGAFITAGSAAGSGLTTFGHAEYSATKAGAAYLTRTVAIEEAHRGIRANVVCPACIAGTGMMTEDDGGPEATLMSSLTALGRMGGMDEVVSLYNYLASDASAFITGQEIRIDGGMTTGIGGPLFGLAAEKAGLG
jgi:NAD(P)-dependent dehydrogenase (short-subunit alcohol dehydrogenase family)